MSSNKLIEELAKAVVMTDARDLPGLVALQEQFQQLSGEIDAAELQPIVDVADRAAKLLDDIVLRQVEDADAALDHVRQCVVYAQDAVAAAEQGKPLTAFNLLLFDGDEQSPDALAESLADEPDLELLEEWISECEHALENLEGEVVAIESTDDPGELIAEIRRKIHTFKGECGVLSLHGAQKLLHEAESAIDEADSDGRPFPIDAILGLIDWMKGYVSQLADDPRAKVPLTRIFFGSLRAIVALSRYQTLPRQTQDHQPPRPGKMSMMTGRLICHQTSTRRRTWATFCARPANTSPPRNRPCWGSRPTSKRSS